VDKYVVIMAGGVGSRFWPLSREKKPKQFISADGGKCMLIQTIERVCQVVPPENCFIITNRTLQKISQETIKDIIPTSNIIEEPLRKNTATCIAYSCMLLKQKFGSGYLSFIPADGFVKDSNNYVKALENAYLAAERTKSIVTIGINPTYPATGYGYIQIDTANSLKKDSKVKKFIEKPDYETAEKFVTSNEYLWNSGIVLADMDVLIDHIRQFLPRHYSQLSEAILHLNAESFKEDIKKAYHEVQNISFDVSVLEKSKNIYTVRGYFDWDDMGSMEALSITLNQDVKGNSVRGKHVGLDTSNCVIYSEDLLITTIGIEDMVVASTKDAIIVCPRNRVQDIKALVNELKIKGYEDFL
jgi:mannose-1-phosphate guanylyltransferase